MLHLHIPKGVVTGALSVFVLTAVMSAQTAAPLDSTPVTTAPPSSQPVALPPTPSATAAPVAASTNFVPLPEPATSPITSPDLIPPPTQEPAPEPSASVPRSPSRPPKPSPTPAILANAAPNFTGGAEAGRKIQLSTLRGTPVLLVIAISPKNGAFRSQMSQLRGSYEKLAAQGTLCFAAFTSESGRIPSNIPFILVNDPASTAASYDVHGSFAVAIIGRDGNLDCLSTTPLPGQRILDLIQNNASMQNQLRR